MNNFNEKKPSTLIDENLDAFAKEQEEKNAQRKRFADQKREQYSKEMYIGIARAITKLEQMTDLLYVDAFVHSWLKGTKDEAISELVSRGYFVENWASPEFSDGTPMVTPVYFKFEHKYYYLRIYRKGSFAAGRSERWILPSCNLL
jgi:hypothetical protein